MATNHGSRSKTRESPESVSSCQRALPTPPKALRGAHSAESGDRGRRRRPASGRAGGRTLTPEYAGRGCRRSGDGPPLGSRREAPRRATRPARGDPLQDRRAPVDPQRLRVRLHRGARPARAARPAPELARPKRPPVRRRCRDAVAAESFRPGTRSTSVSGQHYLVPRKSVDPTSWGWTRVPP